MVHARFMILYPCNTASQLNFSAVKLTSVCMLVRIYVCKYLHTYIPTYIQYVHTYVHTYITHHTYIHTHTLLDNKYT